MKNLTQLRRSFQEGQSLPSNAIDQGILNSWQRCADLGLSMSARANYELLETRSLDRLMRRNAQLLSAAEHPIEQLNSAISRAGWSILLTDQDSVSIHTRCSEYLDNRRIAEAFKVGSLLSEAAIGTTAMSCALTEKKFTRVYGFEHYNEHHRQFHCAATPVFDPLGKVCGALDITSENPHTHEGTFVLLKQCAHNIQLEMIRQMPGCVTLLLNFGPGFALNPGTMTLAIDEQGNIRGANQIASQVLGLNLELSGQLPFEQLFENPIRDLMKLEQEGCQLRLPNGVSLFGQVLSDAEPSARQASTAPSAQQSSVTISQQPKSSAQKTNTEQAAIQFGDDSVNQSLSKAARVIGRLPVLLQGESGSGKEVAAKSLHLMSASASGPLVSLNCAAIPEHLIESELFGYEAGAFTGASKQGYEGKFRQAHGGTLFLDEIGDMPPGLQSRLLRVLETREVVPLGGRQTHPVEFQLVCATHKDLRAMVDRGEFRLDLFYRIQGFNVTLPPVRERQDLKQLCQVLLNEICIPGTEPRQLDAELMNWISAYNWPGNVRQLKNALIYADAMAERDALLGLKDLPDEYRQQAAVPAAREMASDLTSMEDEAPLQQANVRMIEATLARFDGNVSKAAECLGIARSTIYRKLGSRK